MSGFSDKDKTYVANTYSRFPVEIVSGKGSIVFDANGKEYIDMGTGIGVTCFGIADEEWKAAVEAQLDRLQHMSNLYYTKPCADLAELLCNKTDMKKVFFANSGAEANEGAIKTARKYAQDKKGKEYSTIITLKNSFHGRTITTLSATGQDKFHESFTPLTEGFVYCEAEDLEGIKRLVKENKTAGIMFECVQGEGGVIPLSREFVTGLYNLAQDEDIILIADEVQTGNGRCGNMYAYMNYGIKPDIVTTAKGLGGGLPIGAVIFGEKTENVLGFGDHGSTFGGNPVCCAGAISIVNRLDQKLFDEVKAKSEYIINELANAKGVKSVSGAGLMLGIETVRPNTEVIAECMEKGVLCLSAKTKVRLLPALNIPMEALKRAIDIIKEACSKEI